MHELPSGSCLSFAIYYNAPNDEDAVALYERAGGELDITAQRRLDDPSLRYQILDAANKNNMFVPLLTKAQEEIEIEDLN